jgi:hypothetical protein
MRRFFAPGRLTHLGLKTSLGFQLGCAFQHIAPDQSVQDLPERRETGYVQIRSYVFRNRSRDRQASASISASVD